MLERKTRLELATLALARRCSTTELLPLECAAPGSSWARRESNSDGLPHWNLNPARLPIPPRARTDPSRTFGSIRKTSGERQGYGARRRPLKTATATLEGSGPAGVLPALNPRSFNQKRTCARIEATHTSCTCEPPHRRPFYLAVTRTVV